MTLVSLRPDEPSSDPMNETASGLTQGESATAPARSPHQVTWPVAAVTLTILGSLLLTIVVNMTLLGGLHHGRDQRLKSDQLRSDLANGVVPVAGANSDGKIYPLGTVIGQLEIPLLGVREVFSEGTSGEVLNAGPGHRRDSVLPGQAGTSVIFGRRAAFGGPFADIVNLAKGDEIRATTGQGTHTYKVREVVRVNDGQQLPVDNAKNQMFLVTAAGGALVPNGNLILVEADLASDVQPTAQRVISAASIGRDEQPMAGDSGAWVRLVFWLQALLIAAIGFTIARARWGKWQAWIVGVPLLLAIAVPAANQVALLLPNLM